jgi:DNA repair exonuclease SbcCD ATPase subunit
VRAVAHNSREQTEAERGAEVKGLWRAGARAGETLNPTARKSVRGVSMQPKLIVFLEEINREIGGLVSKLSEDRLEGNTAVVAPGELKVLAEKLAQVAKLLDQVPPAQPKQEGLQAVINEYTGNLETLKGLLTKVQDSLSKRRDRLKKDLQQLKSARGWVETFRATS